MLAEWRGLEYVFEVLRVLNSRAGRFDSKEIAGFIQSDNRIQVNVSYVQKMLPRMSKSNLLSSTTSGYQLIRPLNEIMMSEVLELCTMPEPGSPLHKVCAQLKAAVSLSGIDEFYDFK